MVNSFEHRIFIDDIPYTIAVDATDGDRKRIVVNKTVVYDDICASWMSPKCDIMYFSFYIKNKYIVVSVDDRELTFKYNIFIDNVSPIDGADIEDDYRKASSTLKNGLKQFVKSNCIRFLIESILLGVALPFFNLVTDGEKLTPMSFLIAGVSVIVFFPVFIIAEWGINKSIVKNYKKRFRNKSVVRI